MTGADTGNLYATTLYLTPDQQTEITPIPFDTENKGHLRQEGLQRRGELVLMVTADTPGTFRYVAAAPSDLNDADRTMGPLRQHVSDVIPNSTTFAFKNRAQPSFRPTNLTPKTYLEPKTEIHLASDYTDVKIGGIDEDYLYAASRWGLEIFSLIEPTKPTHVGEIATPGQARAVTVDGETAYIADGTAGVHVIDIAIPTDPSIVKTIRGFTDASQVRVADGNLYALDKDRGTARFPIFEMFIMLERHHRDVSFAPQVRLLMSQSMMILSILATIDTDFSFSIQVHSVTSLCAALSLFSPLLMRLLIQEMELMLTWLLGTS